MKVNQINVTSDMKIVDLIDQFDKSGVLGAGRVGKACNILTEMINFYGLLREVGDCLKHLADPIIAM